MTRRSILFCSYCGAKLIAPDVRFCAACGGDLAELTARGAARVPPSRPDDSTPASRMRAIGSAPLPVYAPPPPPKTPPAPVTQKRRSLALGPFAVFALAALLGGLAFYGGLLPGPWSAKPTPRVFYITLPPYSTPGQTPGTFAATGSMTMAREYATATLLADGRVLIAGGDDAGAITRIAEIYTPANGKFAATGAMTEERSSHTATLLGDGRVLIAGGIDNHTPGFKSAEIYDPASGTFSATGAMSTVRLMHSAIALDDGRVLVLGGSDGTKVVSSAEIYDPASGTFGATGSMVVARAHAVVVRLGDGRILVVGGDGPGFEPLQTAEIYDPASGTFRSTATAMSAKRTDTAAILLGDGRVLVAGGQEDMNYLSSAELYDPKTDGFAATGSLAEGRAHLILVGLPSGGALVVGGAGLGSGKGSSAMDSTEIFDPTRGAFVAGASLAEARFRCTATQLYDGRILVAGGISSGTTLASAEVYQP